MNYVGIDIHKRYSVCAAQDERGRQLAEARIEGNAADGFVQYFQRLGGKARVVIEACWNWGKVYDTLESIPEVEEVVLAHPLKTRLIADAQIKTDKLDARALALLLRGNFIARAHVPRLATRRRKDLLRQRPKAPVPSPRSPCRRPTMNCCASTYRCSKCWARRCATRRKPSGPAIKATR